MKIIRVRPENLSKIRQTAVSFVSHYGDDRITHKAIRWLKNLRNADLEEEGTVILIALEENQLQGLLAISDYGRDQSIVVVRTDHRQKGIGLELIRHLLTCVDKAYGRVALDNIPSLKMCFAMGMVGFKLTEGPTGKPTLWLGLGQWKKEDIE